MSHGRGTNRRCGDNFAGMVVQLRFVVVAALLIAGYASAQQGSDAPTIGRRVWSVGVESGNPAQEFGVIIAAALGGDGTVYLLDEQNHTIRIFGADGSARGTIGRRGDGPCELQQPKSMVHDGKERLYVLDWQNGLTALRTTPGSRPTCVYTRKLPFLGSDLCVLNGSLYVYSFTTAGILHKVSTSGDAQSSFGAPINTGLSAGASRMIAAWGRVGCVPSSARIVTSLVTRKQIQATDLVGKPIWRDTLIDFLDVLVTPNGRGHTIRQQDDGLDQVGPMILLRGDTLMVQVARRLGLQTVQVRTCFLLPSTGKCLRPTTDLPVILAVRDGKAVTLRKSDFPVVELVEFRR